VKRRKQRKPKPPVNAVAVAEAARAWMTAFRPLIAALVIALVLTLAVFKLEHLRHEVLARPEFSVPVRVKLVVSEDQAWVDTEDWRERIETALQLPGKVAEQPAGLSEETLMSYLAEHIQNSGWVARLDKLTRGVDGTVYAACKCRRPIAMILVPKIDLPDRVVTPAYIPVDPQGYRLPEVYERVSDWGWMQVIGVDFDRSQVPEVGQRFEAEDALAGIQIAWLVFQQDYAAKIGAIDVRNFRGRQDRYREHILVWPRNGEAIVWGSAVREEFEETTVENKLRQIAKVLEAGWPQARIDVSVLPHAAIERPSPILRTADGSARRGR
jgi:hypothetical protein